MEDKRKEIASLLAHWAESWYHIGAIGKVVVSSDFDQAARELLRTLEELLTQEHTTEKNT